ncbi:MAG: multidrug ABC transporter substrate-binding protein [Acidobacteria bacterium]|nr:MAG: multidrug ABC transporter substrate-binding protein [Acidobacteriota bacterium]
MNLKTVLREAFLAMRRNWIRSILTILGIAVGVGAFICVVAIGHAGSARIQDQLQSLGNNFVWIEAGSRTRGGMRMGSRGTRSLVLGDAEAIVHQVPLIKTMSPNVDGHTQVVYGNENWSTQYRGVTPEFLNIRRWTVRLGTFFSEADVESDAPVCVLGQTVVENLFGDEDPVGKTVRVRALPCTVVGVLRGKGFSATGQDQDDFIVMPYTTVQKRITGEFWLDDIFCSAVSREAMPEATRQIVGLLRERHHLNPAEDEDFNVRRPEDVVQAQLAASQIMTALLATVASLSLLVGGIGIMNIMLVSVTQRTREIGVRLAVGATEWDVQIQFLSEAITLSLLGGALGLLAGIGSSYAVEDLFEFPTKLTVQVFVFGGLFAAGVGILFGYYPARKAAQLDPIQGLRYE